MPVHIRQFATIYAPCSAVNGVGRVATAHVHTFVDTVWILQLMWVKRGRPIHLHLIHNRIGQESESDSTCTDTHSQMHVN